MTDSSTQTVTAPRAIVARTHGSGHGGITRLMSPSDLGQRLKPFVFLDLFDADAAFAGAMPIHPHSGIATVTVLTEGDARFDDPDAGTGTIDYGGVEWMRASGGVWHGQEMSKGASPRIRGFQLWLALPPELENGPVDSQYVESDRIPRAGPARVVLGSYDDVRSPVRAPPGINYLLVTLAAGEGWTYTPPPDHGGRLRCGQSGAAPDAAARDGGRTGSVRARRPSVDLPGRRCPPGRVRARLRRHAFACPYFRQLLRAYLGCGARLRGEPHRRTQASTRTRRSTGAIVRGDADLPVMFATARIDGLAV